MFCRHNRPTNKCAICSNEQEPPPIKYVTVRKPGTTSSPRGRGASTSGGTAKSTSSRSTKTNTNRLVTRKLTRAADDGYRNPLAPGLKATADAERLAGALTQAVARLEPPGPYAFVAEIEDPEQATWLAFLAALAPDLREQIETAQPAWGEDPQLPQSLTKTIDAYKAWVERQGSQDEAFTGEPSWTPERRFDRVFERLNLPGFTRAARFDLLTGLGSAGLYPLEAGQVQFVEDDATTLAAKRLLVSGDRMLLERRAKDFAEAAELPIAALDHGLAVWGTPGEHVDLTVDPLPGVASALRIG